MASTIAPDTGVEIATDAVARALKAGADQANAFHRYAEMFEVNFDTDDVTLVRSTVSDSVGITVFSETKTGSGQLTGRNHDAVERVVDEALDAARSGAPDEANVLPDLPTGTSPSDDDPDLDKGAMIEAALRHIDQVRKEFPAIRGDNSTYSFVTSWATYADSNDRVQHVRRNHYQLGLLVAGKDGVATTSMNFTGHTSTEPIADITALPSVRRLLENTMATFDARPVPQTFVGDVIFTPESVGTLIGSVLGAMDGASLFRQSTPFLDKLGQRIAVPELSILHRPSGVVASSPFDGNGFAPVDIDIVRDGVLENFIINWYFSRKLGRPRTTGDLSIVVPPGDTALEDLIANTERGIILGRFSGGGPSPSLDFSGVAKNSFYVEDGKIQFPITETMIAGNFADALLSIRAISRETVDFGSSRDPWIAVGGVTVSTK